MSAKKKAGGKKGGKATEASTRLLTRDEFREMTFARDGGKCIFCDAKATEAHHIVERRLFPDGGYYLDNGASVCNPHHLECEMTTRSTEEVRAACGITRICLPDHLDPECVYDKWANIVMPNGRRLPGELFFDDSVQKILAVPGTILDLFDKHYKFPRIFHLPWSPGGTADDKRLADTRMFEGEQVVVLEKMDGENTSIYRDYIHGRSADNYRKHESRDWMKGYHAEVCWNIPENWRVCGENMYAKHSVAYKSLPSFFMAFNVFDDRNVCLSYDETASFCTGAELVMPRVLYRGPWDVEAIKACFQESGETEYGGSQEGYVVRLAREFPYSQYRNSVAKFVRNDFNQCSEENWYATAVVPNTLRAA